MEPCKIKSFALKTWPNGEFGIGYYRRFNPPPAPKTPDREPVYRTSWTISELKNLQMAIEAYGCTTAALERMAPGFWPAVLQEILHPEVYAQDSGVRGESEAMGGSPPLGSSNVPNSLSRASRGTHGLTSYGRRMIRNACWLMEGERRQKRVGMVTCTIPTCSTETAKKIVASWSQILKVFLNWLTRRVQAVRPRKAWVVGVTEIQTERQLSEGGLPLHLHALFVCKRGNRYIVSPSDIQAAWKRAVVSSVDSAYNLYWGASTRVETVRKNLTAYISKYFSKGNPEQFQSAIEQGYQPPSSWWFAVGRLKRQVAKMRGYYTDERANSVWGLCHSSPELFDYIHKVTLQREGGEFVIGIAGKMPRGILQWLKDSS